MKEKKLLTYDELICDYSGEHLRFSEQANGSWLIENKDPDKLGYLEKVRIGAWMSWCLFLEDGCYLSASCQDEVREMTKILNAKKCVKPKSMDLISVLNESGEKHD